MSRLRDGCISLLQRPDLRVRDGGLIWTETSLDGTSRTYDMDPATTALKRAAARVVSWLPVGWVL
jgi:hypothetical protein